SAGQVTGNASATFTLNGVTLTRDTDPATRTEPRRVGKSGPATKTFEDARIRISPDATNGITEPHTFTATVEQDDRLTAAQGGDGVTGFAPSANRTVTVTLSNQNGASASPAGPFTLTTDANGQVSVTFTSASAGQVIGNASTSFVLNGVTLTRDTDPAT